MSDLSLRGQIRQHEEVLSEAIKQAIENFTKQTGAVVTELKVDILVHTYVGHGKPESSIVSNVTVEWA